MAGKARAAMPVSIGWASGSITPEGPVLLDGQFHARVSERVNDPLTVTALALEREDEPGARVIFVSCDMVGVTADVLERVRKGLAQRLSDFDPRHLILSATHTHTAMVLDMDKYPLPTDEIMTPDECADMFVDRVADVAAEAWGALRPGGVSWAFAQAVVGHNRRAVFADGSAKMYADTSTPDFESIEGYEDHSVDLLYTFDEREKLTGMIVNLACPSQETEGERFVSADFWHEARAEIRSHVGDGVFVLPQCAPAGDQSPHLLFNKDLERVMRERRGLTSRQEIGRRIARAVVDGLEGARRDVRWDLPLAHHVERLPLPRRMVTDEEREQALSEIAALEADTEIEASQKQSFLRRNRRVLARYEAQAAEPHLSVDLHVLRLGDAAFATNPFELFLDYGTRIKARSAALQTFCIQLTCGSSGYLPTTKAVQARPHVKDKAKLGFSGNYGAGVASNQVGPEGGQLLADRTVERIREMWQAAE